MSDVQSGFMSNLYSYDPIKDYDGPAAEWLGAVGGGIGQMVAYELKANPVVSTIIEQTSTFAGQYLGAMIDNRETIINNANTLLTELNDWRSYQNIMGPGTNFGY